MTVGFAAPWIILSLVRRPDFAASRPLKNATHQAQLQEPSNRE